VTIVGRTLVPLINVSQDLSVGEGALIDRPLLDRVGGAHVALALVDLRPGSSIDDLRAALGQAGPRLAAGTVFGPTHTADLRGYDAVRGTPLLLAGVLALMGLGVLGYTIAAVTTRRRRELAVMRCLGSLRRDLRSSIRWNAIMIVISCLAVALPLGVALGRVLWQVFAQGLGVSDDAVTPLLALGAVVTATGLSAVLLAIVPGLRAGRMRPAEVLRGE
ncbi:MAG: FtsX-like permease family protein, partial [Frankiaceae bacterium]|nr:FtsX-like permease family protein [Frankiaceae bacterium]